MIVVKFYGKYYSSLTSTTSSLITTGTGQEVFNNHKDNWIGFSYPTVPWHAD